MKGFINVRSRNGKVVTVNQSWYESISKSSTAHQKLYALLTALKQADNAFTKAPDMGSSEWYEIGDSIGRAIKQTNNFIDLYINGKITG